ALQALHEVMTSGIEIVPKQFCKEVKPHEQNGKDDEAIRQDDLWHIIADHLDHNNLVFSDQGTAYFGISDVRLPEGVTSYGQPMWGSIGYTLPASLGGAIASPDKRSVLLIGDGSALLTVQEIAVMIQERINSVIVLVNNDGYTVERAIHGENQHYNDIPKCNWQLMPQAFGATEDNSLVLKVETAGELKSALIKAAETTDKLVMIEVIADKHDIPPLLADISAALKPKAD
ncbi:MAG: thiamine pyrophosphate-dependent enzyme, partial [Psychrobacter alimentarius]